jgi:TMEM175 potassium channel family protein
MTGETDLARIARIGDSVFAVTITLLAYRVRIPGHDALLSGELSPLLPFLDDLLAVLLSAFVASMFWISHWRVFRRMRQSDIKFVALNFVFLGTLILLPTSTALISVDLTRIGTMAYSGNLFLATTAGFFLRMHARRIDPQAFDPGRLLLTPALGMAIFGGAVIVSVWSPRLAMALWCFALALPWIERQWGFGPSA